MEKLPEKKIEKLVAMVLRGDGGEKENAEKILHELCDKHGLVYEDLFLKLAEPVQYEHRITNKMEKELFVQIVYVYTDCENVGHYALDPFMIVFKISPCQYLELMGLWPIFQRAFRKEKEKILNNMALAFIQRNRIFKDTPEEPREEKNEAEQRRFDEALRLSQGMDRVEIRKQLTSN